MSEYAGTPVMFTHIFLNNRLRLIKTRLDGANRVGWVGLSVVSRAGCGWYSRMQCWSNFKSRRRNMWLTTSCMFCMVPPPARTLNTHFADSGRDASEKHMDAGA
jgi:hypothetical protein